MRKKINSFTEDIFKRKNVADYITEIIKNKEQIFDEQQSLVIAIDSPWGTGKTTFLELWKKELELNEKFTVISYNAWKEDDYNNPLIPLSTKITKEIKGLEEDIKNKILQSAKIIGLSMIENIIGYYLSKIIGQKLSGKIGTILKNGLGDAENISDIVSELCDNSEENKYINDYEYYQYVKGDLRDALEKATKGKKVVFLIDELDRCQPIYAIKILETIKHYFNIADIIFVFALDMEQLKHSIATIYGHNMDSYGYIRRFFNHCIRMPKPDMKQYVTYINDNTILNTEDHSPREFINDISELFNHLNFTFRDADVVYSNIKILYILKIREEDNRIPKLLFYSYLIGLKYKEPKSYEILIHDTFQITANGVSKDNDIRESGFGFELRKFKNMASMLSEGKNNTQITYYRSEEKTKEFFDNNIKIEKFKEIDSLKLSEYIEMVMEGFIL